MKDFLRGFAIAFLAGGVIAGAFLFLPARSIAQRGVAFIYSGGEAAGPREKTIEERVAEARERSSRIKGLYMTADVANEDGAGARRLRERIIRIAEETEISGIVIDVKEVCGADYDEKRLRRLINELKAKNIWTVARIVAFKDASQVEAHPEWYLTRKTEKRVGDECLHKRDLRSPSSKVQVPGLTLWQDKRDGYWLDPASAEVHEYLLEFSKRMIDLGFDELQFDYIRFPSDGDVENAIYPAWDKKTARHEVLRNFFIMLRDELKSYKPEIILSADLFGYVAAQREDKTIGQRLDDIGDAFDYVSFMVYPSHYYNGLALPGDAGRGLPPIDYTFAEARANPDAVVGRSLLFARDFLDGKIATPTSATATSAEVEVVVGSQPRQRARLRPWLEDFFHEEDRAAGRPYGAQKVRMQIDAAERVEDHGWLLWNAANVYSEEALKKDE